MIMGTLYDVLTLCLRQVLLLISNLHTKIERRYNIYITEMNEWMMGLNDGDGWMNEWMNEPTNQRKNQRTNKWMLLQVRTKLVLLSIQWLNKKDAKNLIEHNPVSTTRIDYILAMLILRGYCTPDQFCDCLFLKGNILRNLTTALEFQ